MGLVVTLVVLLVVVHLPPVRALVFRQVAGALRTGLDLDLQAASLHYNLLTLRAELRDVRLAAVRTPDAPFLEAQAVTARFGPSTLIGVPDIRAVGLREPIVSIRDDEAGGNLPAFGGSADGGGSWPIPSIDIDDLDVLIERADLRAELTDVAIRAVPTDEPGVVTAAVDVAGGGTYTSGGSTWDLTTAGADMGFDGRVLTIEQLAASRPGSVVRVSGTADLSGDAGLDLNVSGSSDLASWNAVDDPDTLLGATDFTGTVEGPITNPVATIAATGTGVAWDTYRTTALEADAEWRDGVLTVARFTGDLGDGTIAASGVLPLGDAGATSRIEAEWSGVAPALFLAADAEQPAVAPLRTDGSGTVTWQGSAGSTEVSIEAAVDARTDRPAGVQLRASLAGSTWTVDVTSRRTEDLDVSARATVQLQGDSWRDYALDGQMSAGASDLEQFVRLLEGLGIPMGGMPSGAIGGSATITSRLGGTLERPLASGSLVGRSVRWSDAPLLDVEATFAVDVARDTSEGTFHIVTSDVGSWVAGQLPELRATGSGEAEGRWSGPVAAPVVDLAIATTDLSSVPTGTIGISGTARVSLDAIAVDQLVVTQSTGGRLSAEGRWDLSSGEASLRADGTGLQLVWPGEEDAAPAGVEDLAIALDVSGPFDDLRGTARLSAQAVAAAGRQFGAVVIEARAADGALSVTASAPDWSATGSGTLSLTAPRTLAARGEVGGLPLAQLLAAFDLETAPETDARVNGVVAVDGDFGDWSALRTTIEVEPIDTLVDEVPVALRDTARITVDAGRIRVADTVLAFGDVAVTVGGEFSTAGGDGALSAIIDGDLASLGPWIPSDDGERPWSVGGRVSGRFDVSRSADGLSLTGAIDTVVSDVSRDGEPMARDIRFVLEAADDRLIVRELSASATGMSARATGSVPLGWANDWLPSGWQFPASGPATGATVEASASVDIAALSASPDAEAAESSESLAGALVVEARATAAAPTLQALVATVTMTDGRLTSGDGMLAQVEPTRLDVSDGQLTIQALHWQSDTNTISASGTIGLVSGAPTDARASVETDLRLFQPFLPGRAAGRIAADATVVSNGDEALQIGGDATLTDASWLLPDAKLLFAGWSGRVTLEDSRVAVDALGGTVNGGRVDIAGGVDLADAGPAGQITIEARDILLDVPQGLYSQLAASLVWDTAGGTPTLGGTITVTANRYSEPITRILELVDAAAPSGASDESGLPALLAATRLAIAVEVTDPVIVDNSLGSLELVADLQIVGTLDAPALDGEITALDDGRIRLGGRTYTLQPSALRFSPAEGLMPTFDAVGETRIGEYDVQLHITGAANRMELSYTSSPPLPERDLRSLVITGRTESGSAADDGQDFAIAAAATDVLGFAGKFVGLDSVRLGAADLDLINQDVNPAQHLTISKTFGRVLELIFSENLEDGALSWVVSWKPLPAYDIRFASIENQDLTLEFRQELAFGPGSAASNTRAAATPSRIVEAVTVTGSPGFPDDEVARQLRVRTGRRFDVRRWTEDRLRLERFYHRRGYELVRIAPTREDAGDPDAVRLVYDITRGPEAEIVVVGDGLPGAAIDEMYAMWRGVPIPEILTDEFAAIARRHLARQRYYQPEVEVAFSGDGEESVQAEIRVDRGTRTRSQTIVFTGQAALSTEDLEAEAVLYTGEASPWVDPAALVRGVRQQYAARGYLSTEVTVGAPSFEGNAATLVVTIDEGPLATVRQVVLEGVADERRAAALDAVALPAGTPFGFAAPVDAHRRLERYYADLGFRDAVVRYAVTPSEDGAAIELTFSVQEGPVSIIERASVSGVETTARALVDDAITFGPGDRATPAAADATRTNLFDIGSFRRVDVAFEPEPAGPADGRQPVVALVTAEEPRKYQLRYGLEVSSPYSLTRGGRASLSYGGSVELRDRNLFGRAMQGSVGFAYQRDRQALSLLLAAPRTFGHPIRSSIYARERRETDESEEAGIELGLRERDVTLEQRWRPTPSIELAWGYQFGFRRYSLITEDRTVNFDGFLAGPSASFVVDRRDAPLDATRGWFHSSSLQLGVEWLGSDLGYARYLGRQTGFLPIGPITLAGSLRLGTIQAYSGTAPLSALDLLFQAGGSNSVRGYPHGSLSAADLLGIDLGGADLLILNGEVRFPIYWWFSGVTFVDAGNTFLTLREATLGGLATSAGFGIRFNTPFASLRLDAGRPLTDTFGAQRWRLHFSVGQMF